MVPDKNRGGFISTSGWIPLMLISLNHVLLSLHPVIFIWFFKMLHQECYCDKRFQVIHTPAFLTGPCFSGSAPWGFYKEWGFYFLLQCFFQVLVLQKIPMMVLFCLFRQKGKNIGICSWLLRCYSWMNPITLQNVIRLLNDTRGHFQVWWRETRAT